MKESVLSKNLSRDLRRRGFIVHNPTASMYGNSGWADLTVIRSGCIVCIELKVGNNKLSKTQEKIRREFIKNKTEYVVLTYSKSEYTFSTSSEVFTVDNLGLIIDMIDKYFMLRLLPKKG